MNISFSYGIVTFHVFDSSSIFLFTQKINKSSSFRFALFYCKTSLLNYFEFNFKMSETKELQTDEREALISIYEGDSQFHEVNGKTFQYKYGETDTTKSFLMEISWPENYPNDLPSINLDLFYNRNL